MRAWTKPLANWTLELGQVPISVSPFAHRPKIMTSAVIDQKIRVLITDDHPIFREGLTTILSLQKDVKVVAEASDGEEICQLYDELSHNILILYFRMTKKENFELETELMAR